MLDLQKKLYLRVFYVGTLQKTNPLIYGETLSQSVE